jgi:4-amino-4-deoxy-L-arabinose transferase-like glycosyltransferase
VNGLLSRRDLTIWLGCYLIVAALLVATGFASDDPDSALYAGLSAKLAAGPVSHWIAPEWWGFWDSQGLFREHPAGVFLLPAALGWLGIPTVQAAYVVGVGTGLACLLLIGWLVSRVASPAEGRAALVLLQLMPVAFLFRIRANHEYPMLLCLLLTLIGLDGVRRAWPWTAVVAVSLTAALLIKGVFVAVICLAAGLWLVLNPARQTGPLWRPIAAIAIALITMGAVAFAYDNAYLRVAGERFWIPYWHRQVGSVSVATPTDGASTLLHHLGFYLSRLLWHAAPWSLMLLMAAWPRRRSAAVPGAHDAGGSRRGLVFALAFAALAVAVLSPSSRFAERYLFSPVFAIAAAGAVVAYRSWPFVPAALARLERAVPAFPAMLWLATMLMRLVLGPFLPRV